MNTTLSRLLRAGVLAGGLIAVGAGVAHADETTTGQHGLLSGNQVVAPIQVPVTIDGNAIAVLGHSVVHGAKPASSRPTGAEPAGRSHATTAGRHSVASGNQVVAPVTIPVTVGGNAISLLGRSDATSGGPSATGSTGSGVTGSSGVAAPSTSGDGGVGAGNQVLLPICVPVNANGNAVNGRAGSAPATGCSSALVSPVRTDPTTPGTATDPATPTDPTSAGTATDPATPTYSGTPIGSGADPSNSTVLGERLRAGLSALTSDSDSGLAQTGGVAVRLAAFGALLVAAGAVLRGTCARRPSAARSAA